MVVITSQVEKKPPVTTSKLVLTHARDEFCQIIAFLELPPIQMLSKAN
jgi:hypothetical protein